MDIAEAKNIRAKMSAAEGFIMEEAAKVGVKLTKEQACIFANAVLKA